MFHFSNAKILDGSDMCVFDFKSNTIDLKPHYLDVFNIMIKRMYTTPCNVCETNLCCNCEQNKKNRWTLHKYFIDNSLDVCDYLFEECNNIGKNIFEVLIDVDVLKYVDDNSDPNQQILNFVNILYPFVKNVCVKNNGVRLSGIVKGTNFTIRFFLKNKEEIDICVINKIFNKMFEKVHNTEINIASNLIIGCDFLCDNNNQNILRLEDFDDHCDFLAKIGKSIHKLTLTIKSSNKIMSEFPLLKNLTHLTVYFNNNSFVQNIKKIIKTNTSITNLWIQTQSDFLKIGKCDEELIEYLIENNHITELRCANLCAGMVKRILEENTTLTTFHINNSNNSDLEKILIDVKYIQPNFEIITASTIYVLTNIQSIINSQCDKVIFKCCVTEEDMIFYLENNPTNEMLAIFTFCSFPYSSKPNQYARRILKKNQTLPYYIKYCVKN